MPVSAEVIPPAPDLTQVNETVQARLTQAVTATLLVMLTPSPVNETAPSATLVSVTSSPSQTPQPGVPTWTQQAVQACDRAAAGSPIDVSVPDDTSMEPGQPFTKIWRLQNAGECTWTTGYRVTFFSGEMLGAVNNLALSREVSKGESIDIAIDMVAPNRAGTFQGNWKLRNPDGMAFGIGPSGSAAFWVRIVVEVTPTPTPTRTLTPTPGVTQPTQTPDLNTATPSLTPTQTQTPPTNLTPTQTPPTSLTVTLNPGDSLDLDTGEVNITSGQDILYESNPDGLHRITPQNEARLGIYGEQAPDRADCEAADLEATSLVAMNLVQRYVCYQTDEGQPGWAFMQEINPNTYTARLEFLTWTAP